MNCGVEKTNGCVVAVADDDVVGNVAPGDSVIYGKDCSEFLQYPCSLNTTHILK